MTLADFTSPALIIPHLRGQDVTSVIQELSRAMHGDSRVPDFLPFYHTALNREFLVSTDMDAGMAFPHARMPGLKEVSFAFGRTDEPILWGHKGVRTVRNVFLLAVPATDSTQYLALISGLARFGKQPELMKGLLAARDIFQILEIFQSVNLGPNATPPKVEQRPS